MHHHGRSAFARNRRWRFIEAGIEEAARGRGGKPERMRLIRLLDNGPVVWQGGHLRPRTQARSTKGRVRPVGLEVKFLVCMRKTIEVMRGAKIWLDIAPQVGLERCDIAVPALLQRSVDQFA